MRISNKLKLLAASMLVAPAAVTAAHVQSADDLNAQALAQFRAAGEETGEFFDDLGEDTGDAMDEAADESGDFIDETGDDIEDTAEDLDDPLN